jgi:hypothetical protein
MPKKKYLDKREVLDHYFEIEGSFDDLVASLEQLKKTHPNHYNFKLEHDYYGYDGAYNLLVIAYRKETDDERKARLIANRKAKEARESDKKKREEEEYQQYLRLKEKYKKLGEGFYNG